MKFMVSTTDRCALLLAASVAIGLTTASSVAAPGASNCEVVRIGELPVRLAHNKVIVEGAINGQKINVALDTGATSTLILRPGAKRLGLTLQKASGRLFGIGGETDVESAFVDEFKLGQAVVKGRRMLVAGEHEIGDDIVVLLGADFFHLLDVEFDLAHNVVRLFQIKNCDGMSPAYWATNGAHEVQIEAVSDVSPGIFLTVRINGHAVRAWLDSGAGASLLDKPAATRLGVIPEAPDVKAGKATGLGEKSMDSWVGSLQSFVIGDETIKDTTIFVTDMSKDMSYTQSGTLARRRVEPVGMLLGADFLLAHRVLIAHSQRKIYFTYAGGPVFQRRGRGDPDSTIANYDVAIRMNPQNAEAFLARGNAWYEKRDYERSIADFDAAIRINPQYASAFGNRGGARVAKGDFDQGIADLTRAVEINPRLAAAYVNRGIAKQRTGDPEGAIADYTHAIEIDPKLAAAHNQLAWELATAEKPAVRDGRRAVESALKACELSQWNNPSYIDTLAAAYARAGNFEDAIKWQRKAAETPRLAGDDKAAQRLRLYEEGKAWPSD